MIAAVLVGLPFLATSFFAQSSFKETALALFVLGFALSLAALSREGPEPEGEHPDRALVAGIGLLAVASVLTFSVPGLAWFGLGGRDLARRRADRGPAAVLASQLSARGCAAPGRSSPPPP